MLQKMHSYAVKQRKRRWWRGRECLNELEWKQITKITTGSKDKLAKCRFGIKGRAKLIKYLMLVRGTGTSQGIKCDKDVSSCHHLLQHLVRTNLFVPPPCPVVASPGMASRMSPWVTRGLGDITRGLRDVTAAPGLQTGAHGTAHPGLSSQAQDLPLAPSSIQLLAMGRVFFWRGEKKSASRKKEFLPETQLAPEVCDRGASFWVVPIPKTANPRGLLFMWRLAKRAALLRRPENLSVLLGWKRGVKVSPAAGIKGLEAARPPGVRQDGVAGTALSCKYGAFQLCSTTTKKGKNL